MATANNHFQAASNLLDIARFDADYANYLLAADQFEAAASETTTLIAGTKTESQRQELSGLSSYYSYEAWRSRATYFYEIHNITKAKEDFTIAKQFSLSCMDTTQTAIDCESDTNARQRLMKRHQRQKLCHAIDDQWIAVCDARHAFDQADWEMCQNLYRVVLSGFQNLSPMCKDVNDPKITRTLEANHFVILLNYCQATIGAEQSRAAKTVKGIQLSPSQASLIVRNWLNNPSPESECVGRLALERKQAWLRVSGVKQNTFPQRPSHGWQYLAHG